MDLSRWADAHYPELANRRPINIKLDLAACGVAGRPSSYPHLTLTRIGGGPAVRLQPVAVAAHQADGWRPLDACMSMEALIRCYGVTWNDVCANHPTEGYFRVSRIPPKGRGFLIQKDRTPIMQISPDGGVRMVEDCPYAVADIVGFLAEYAYDLSSLRIASRNKRQGLSASA